MQQEHNKFAHFGIQQGYALHGDFALLSAEFEVPSPNADWSIQLWACDGPAATGELDGVMVAEAPVDAALVDPDGRGALHTRVPARLPISGRDYAMVMALARRDGSGAAEIHAVSNFNDRQWFSGPCLQGAAGYRVEGDNVSLTVDAVYNPRLGNVSGTLALELWAFAAPYDGRQQKDGQHVAGLELGCLAGQTSNYNVSGSTPFFSLQPGRWHMALLLREWTALGYVTRDYRAFDEVYDNTLKVTVATPEPTKDTRVCINTATVAELSKVPGLTQRLAQEIVRKRPFKALDELLSVRGIGDKTLRKMRTSLKT